MEKWQRYVKKLFYQLFVFGNGQVEVFFLLSVISAFIFYPFSAPAAFVSFVLPLFFIRGKSGFLIALVILALNVFAGNALLVTGEKLSDGGKRLYTTTSGTLVADSALSAGNAVYGGYIRRSYAGEEGRFSGGYYIEDGGVKSFRVPLVENILQYRQRLSDGMFASTGGRLRLTQGIMLGDRQYIDRASTDRYQLTGLGHLLAISGLHVGLYTMVCYLIFGFLPSKLRLIPAWLMLLFLIPFTGFKIPVLRAGLIGICILTAKFFDYQTDFRKLLLFFAGVFILISPSMIASPSFLLSFSAVYGLLHLNLIRHPSWLTPFMVGAVATIFILPVSSVTFGSINITSALTTTIMIPVLSLQLVTFLIYTMLPSLAAEPLILLEKIHLWLVYNFADIFGSFFTLYRTDIFWAFAMAFFLYACLRMRVLWLAFVLLAIPYLPMKKEAGWYFPNMGRSKGFAVVDEGVHIFYKGTHTDFLYRFIPYLAGLGIRSADSGTVDIYGGENIFIPIENAAPDYGGVCVNSVDERCKAVYHTRAGTYKCDDDRVHILYKNGCKTPKTYLLSETGDLKIDNPSE